MKKYIVGILLLFFAEILSAQDLLVKIQEAASLEQVYGETYSSEELLPMNDLDMEFGYVLYTTQATSETSRTVKLEIENVRDYAAFYLDGKHAGSLTAENSSLSFHLPEGDHVLQLYVENIGRITYGPEILDNSKGLFGQVTLQNRELTDWRIIPLNIRGCEAKKLNFVKQATMSTPAFYKGSFTITDLADKHLDMTGWGMGEAWINGEYLGAYWEREAQQSIPVPTGVFRKGENEIVIFDLKSDGAEEVKITDHPVFK